MSLRLEPAAEVLHAATGNESRTGARSRAPNLKRKYPFEIVEEAAETTAPAPKPLPASLLEFLNEPAPEIAAKRPKLNWKSS